jgi:hypothetical protein
MGPNYTCVLWLAGNTNTLKEKIATPKQENMEKYVPLNVNNRILQVVSETSERE